MNNTTWVAVDWGTSSLRIWGMSADNETTFAHASAEGMNLLSSAQQFQSTLVTVLDAHIEWTESEQTVPMPVVCCGMVGARQGWVDVGYRALPWQADCGWDHSQLVKVPVFDSRFQVYILAGLCQQTPADVMRGEETQLMGLLQLVGKQSLLACFPGTHSKWIQVVAGEVGHFTTHLTGELFALLRDSSVLRFSMGSWSDQEFVSAVKWAYDHPQAVLSQLFSLRAQGLVGNDEFQEARLSGWLIGAELVVAFDNNSVAAPIYLCGADSLVSKYQRALDAIGADSVLINPTQATLTGLTQAYACVASESAKSGK